MTFLVCPNCGRSIRINTWSNPTFDQVCRCGTQMQMAGEYAFMNTSASISSDLWSLYKQNVIKNKDTE